MEKTYYDYEYMTVTVNSKTMRETVERYNSLGWEVDGQEIGMIRSALTFKRDRNIKNKDQLNRLQRRIDDGADSVKNLEKGKKKGTAVFASIFGSLAALMFGGGMSLIMFNPPEVSPAFIGGLALGVIGAGIATLAYPIYKIFVKKKTAKNNLLIERKKDELADLWREAKLVASN